MTDAESSELYDRCQSGDLPDQEAAYQALGRLLHASLWRRVAGRPELHHLAAECTQESLLVIWQKLDAGRGPREPERFVAWSVVIAINKLREALRRLEPRAKVRRSRRIGLSRLSSLDAPTGPEGSSLGSRLPLEAPGPEDAGDQQALQALIAEIASIDAISEASRTVLLQGYLGGLSDEELAALLNTSRGNVHVIRHRDLAKLRDLTSYLDRLRALFED